MRSAVVARVVRWRRPLTSMALASVVVVHLTIIIASVTNNRLGFDSAYNLSVARNLAHGLGYSSDGYLTTHQVHPFDYRISTGPVVILPVSVAFMFGSVDQLIVARVVVSLFYVALGVGLWLAGRRLSGPWGGVAALAALLAIHTGATPGGAPELQGPSDVLGEFPAAAFAVFALLSLRRHPLLAGLLMGFAVNAKLNSVLFVPAFIIALWLLWDRQVESGRRALRRRIGSIALIAVPTVAFELFAFIALGGGSAYVQHLGDLLDFIKNETPARGAGHPNYAIGAGILIDSWYGPLFLTVGTTFALLWLAILVISRRRESWVQEDITSDREFVAFATFAVIALAVWVLYWLNSAHAFWVRQIITGLVVCAPILVAVFVRLARSVYRASRTGPRPERVGARLVMLALALLLVWQVGVPLRTAIVSDASGLDEEREVAAAMDAFPGKGLLTVSASYLVGQIAFLSDRLIVQVPEESGAHPSGPVLFAGPDRKTDPADGTDGPVSRMCADILLDTANYTVCTLR